MWWKPEITEKCVENNTVKIGNEEERKEIDRILRKGSLSSDCFPDGVYIEEWFTHYRDCGDFAIGDEVNKERFLKGLNEFEGEPERGVLVVYWNRRIIKPRHIAVYDGDGQAVSVWGESSLLVSHGLDMVPTMYGKNRSFCDYFNVRD